MARNHALRLVVLLCLGVACAGCGGGGGGATSPSALEVSPGGAVMAVSAQQSFSAMLSDRAGTAVDWSVQEPGGGSVAQTGDTTATYTAPGVAGTYHVVATSRSDPAQTVSVEVRVILLPPNAPWSLQRR